MNRSLTRPVAPADRMSDVLARSESLVEVIARLAPPFARLRSGAMRRVMARLVTVEQAARVAGIPPERLVTALNEALGIPSAPAEPGCAARPDGASHGMEARAGAAVDGAGTPSAPAAAGTAGGSPEIPPDAPVVELDVRPDLRAGREPFARILSTVAALEPGAVLHLRAPFEPVPLETLLAKRGFVHRAVAHDPEDWSVWFYRPGPGPVTQRATERAASPIDESSSSHADTARSSRLAESPAPPSAAAPARPVEVPLDVRGLEPPEPMIRTLAALEQLPANAVLVQINDRVPHFLLPLLGERGFAFTFDETARSGEVRLRIWRAGAARDDRAAPTG
jgi:uncharacterized protein (DUF2249 family)